MEHGPSENLREKLEIHKRWLNERLQNSHIDSQEDDIEPRQTQQTGSFRGHRRDVSAPPVRNDKLFVIENEHPEDVEEDDYKEHYQNYRDDSTLGLNQSTVTAHTNERERFNNKSHDRSQDRSMDNAKPPKRWEALYNLNRKNLQMKEQISKELENKEKEIDSECTFQPKIRNSHVNQSLLHPLSIHERNKLWKERKEAKLAMTRETGKDKDLEGCTFQPRVSPRKRNESFSGMTNYQTKGIEKYLRRQVVARKIKEEKEMILENPLCRLPENAIRKEGKVTIPRGPKFVEKTQAFDISSLKKPLNPPHLAKVNQNSFYGGKRNSITPLGERSRNESLYWQENNNDHSYYNNEYSQVLQSLHDELHNFEIRYE